MPSPNPRRSTHHRRGSARTTLLWLAACLTAAGLWSSTFTVAEGEAAVVGRFGDPRRLEVEPGLHFKWPAPIDTVYPIDIRRHVLDPPVAEFLTEDQKNVEIDAFVAWHVDEPLTYLTSLRDRRGADDRIGQVLQSVLIEVLKRGPFSDLAGGPDRTRTLDDVRREVLETVSARCREIGYGVSIDLVGIERISFPLANKAAVEKSMRVKRENFAALTRARGNERADEIKTEAELAVQELLADATEEELRIRGKAAAKTKEIEQAAMALNEVLYWRIRSAEIAENALRGELIILPANSPLTSVFDLVAPKAPARATDEPGKDGGDE